MINKINRIQNLGIYRDYSKESELKDFSKFNLFYGWNGSGKTTLSILFRMLETRDIPDEYSDLKLDVEINNQKFTEKNISNIAENIFVFNEDFIDENIDWNEKINKILLLSRDMIKETQEYDKLKEEVEGNLETKTKGLKELVSEEKDKRDQCLKAVEDGYTKIAKNIKDVFQTIDPFDKQYSTLNKTKVQKQIEDKQYLQQIQTCNLSEEQAKELILSIKSNKKEFIKNINKTLSETEVMSLYNKIDLTLNKIVTAKVVDRLKNNKEIANWVETGLMLNKKYHSGVCEFCGSIISEERIALLEGHFNDEVNKLKSELEGLKEEIKKYKFDYSDVIIDSQLFYNEQVSAIETLNANIKKSIDEINEIMNLLGEKIDEKIASPFAQVTLNEKEHIQGILNKYNENIKLQETFIKVVNVKTDNFEKQMLESKDRLIKYYLKKQIEIETILDKINRLEQQEGILKGKQEELEGKTSRLKILESTLSNEVLAAEMFNEKLNSFIGYDELKLQFNKGLRGYEIIRKSTGGKAIHLSEGEKTAIAFVYFLTKLKENNNNIENSIVVIDDPISSFDNNKLFNAYASIRSELEKSKQLFVLTHNFNFFKHIRDWIKKKKSDTEGKYYSIYKIEPVINGGLREGCIKNAGWSLNQTSEYDYVFDYVYRYRDKELEKNDIFGCGNACRKLLEAFLSFKYPDQREGIQDMLNMAFSKKEEQQKNRVYKFINAYSHLNVIEGSEAIDIDSLLAESKGIVKIILDKIEELDSVHYKAMVSNSVSTAEV